jgi:hypothetical protein
MGPLSTVADARGRTFSSVPPRLSAEPYLIAKPGTEIVTNRDSRANVLLGCQPEGDGEEGASFGATGPSPPDRPGEELTR